MPWTARDVETNSDAIFQALAAHGVTPEGALREAKDSGPAGMEVFIRAGIDPNLTLDQILTPEMRERVFLAEGRARAKSRVQKALDRAHQYGYWQLAGRLEGMIEREAAGHARRQMAKLGIAGASGERVPTAGERAVAAAGRGIDYGGNPALAAVGSFPRDELAAMTNQAPPDPVVDFARSTLFPAGLGRAASALDRGATATPEERRADAAAAVSSFMDPLGVPSGALGVVDPEGRDAWRATYQDNPETARFGADLGAIPAFRAAQAGVQAAGRGAAHLGNIAARAPAATATTGGIAAPGQTQQPDQVQTAREGIARLRTEQERLQGEQARLREASRRFDGLRTTDPTAVRQAQEELAAMGLYGISPDGKRVSPDGRWGLGTQDAINRYRQRTEGELATVTDQLRHSARTLSARKPMSKEWKAGRGCAR
jgi:hypothetical protein